MRLTRRRILEGVGAMVVAGVANGCGGGSGSALNPSTPAMPANPNPQPVPAGTVTPASIAVTATNAGSIGAAFAGLSYEKQTLAEPLFSASNSALIGLFRLIGPSVLRIGGNSVDKYVWVPSGPGQTTGQVAPSDVAALAGFLSATGWTCLYGINLGGSATGATTPALAAAEVAYVAQQLGSSLAGIEIGNECDLYGDTGNYYAGNWSLQQFETLWEQYRSAILAQTPSVTLTGPASGSHESTWTVPFGQFATKTQIALLTQHYYRANGQLPTSTPQLLITPDPTLVSNAAIVEAGAAAVGVPWRMAECNSYYNGGSPGVSDAYCSSLWVLDFLFNLVFALAGAGQLYQTQFGATSLNVSAYTVKTPAGGLNVIVVNKDATNSLQLVLTLPQTVKSASLLELTQLTPGNSAPDITATSGVTIQGATVSTSGSFMPAAAYTLTASGTTVNCYVPAYSAVLLRMS
jgi:hypothetical protein